MEIPRSRACCGLSHKPLHALTALGAAPLGSFAQQDPARIARIGYLGATSAVSAGSVARIEALRAGLRDLGYVEGKNLIIEFRWAEGKYDRLPELAADLVRLKVDVIVTQGTPPALAAKRETGTIPIVIPAVGDAVATGLVASLAQPGGNITGSTFFDPEIMSKRLELLKEAMPRMTQAAVLVNPNTPLLGLAIQAMEITGRSLKVKIEQFEVRSPNEFDGAFSAMSKKHIEAVVINEDGMFIANVRAIADLAVKQRILSAGGQEFVEAGGLIGYGANIIDLYRRAAYFVNRILSGTKPSDLPAERAIRFDLVINMKTAMALRVKIPQSVLLRADRVIE